MFRSIVAAKEKSIEELREKLAGLKFREQCLVKEKRIIKSRENEGNHYFDFETSKNSVNSSSQHPLNTTSIPPVVRVNTPYQHPLNIAMICPIDSEENTPSQNSE